jgi:Arf-GAP with SH3 domain, ANK repeat and PH domain-containing protein
LNSDDEPVFNFTFVIRQSAATPQPGAQAGSQTPAEDTVVNGLTFVYASTLRDVENLVTREFHADPNLHKNANVELVGDFSTGGSASVTFDWSWKWKPPKSIEDRGGGWKNRCSFVEYDQRAHKLITLASFTFWVANTSAILSQPSSPSPPFLLNAPPKHRAVSAQSVDSRRSVVEPDEPSSPMIVAPDTASIATSTTAAPSVQDPVKVDVNCARPGDDMTVGDDGPVFRATIKALEQKTGNMRMQMKKVIKKAEQAQTTQAEANEALAGFIEALKEASSTNANAVQPAIDHYFDKIARDILQYQRQNARDLQRVVIEPMHKLYTMDIKQAEGKRRDFEDESKDYYAYVARYLGQRTDSLRTKKLADSDTKYQTKRRNFELKRFDYSSFMQDLSGGRKEQEVLSHLTKYAEAQAKSFLATSKKIENQLPHLEALSNEVKDADKDFQYQRREREEKRRVLEKSNAYVEPESVPQPPNTGVAASNGNHSSSDNELGRADSTGSTLRATATGMSNGAASSIGTDLGRSPSGVAHPVSVGSPSQSSKFKGIRDLEEKDASHLALQESNATQRKEGLLWALNRPGGHVDPRALNKPGWHK